MRLFPRTARRRLAAATIACSVAVGALTVPLAGAEEDLKDQQKQVQKDLEHAADDLEHSSARVRKATGRLDAAVAQLREAKSELADARTRLGAAQRLDQRMQAKLEAAEERLETARAALADGQEDLEVQRGRVTDTITSIYQQGDPQLLAFASILDAQTPEDLTRRMAAQDAMVGRETRAYDGLHAAEVLLQVRENNVEAATNEVADQRRDAAEHLKTMRALHQETREATVKVRGLVAGRRTAQQAAARARAQDQAVLERLQAKERRIKQRILEQARRAKAKHRGYRGATDGLLMRPTAGPVTSPYGYREHPIYHYWGLHDGTDFGAACGSPLYAVSSGTVMTRYYSSVYGNRLYLNVGQVNGKLITAVYNHATRYVVSPGQQVERGQVVGYVGSTGWSTGCHLHFTVLANGSSTNPMPFF
ncbi:peptidoglycan DD-metalloendopeptidase family protein [Nocardioides marmotae]|uniref:Peptidoglycan DD-metalloendopeptidase family protein n=1 Tax=Nocardioides marmotae TaxID=2663857 RepID=A0A6I3JFK7_9ACTN|nr:M23 family metallopeptidase [Nocardioides marmotae]MCR6033357.1 peptidoglycan DD-metalloendopeptidase family protein [Gordonia jinghuaiqii]MBC9734114.1 peptidoglycan DD-metalloendopeptidase family protein [Nocardioides marmotae]MTB85217.1 peptidoglycan DD-metalloendopeptidase family protein [Nocardioides marmotae]MTB97014.1 peptidoglycan DD-metalloendopeptidase family protein [Nocardioides marmotae]QKE00607.1 peptidoglycan DD-metalloendopeptidase family protein [Nocardioides marmotae]